MPLCPHKILDPYKHSKDIRKFNVLLGLLDPLDFIFGSSRTSTAAWYVLHSGIVVRATQTYIRSVSPFSPKGSPSRFIGLLV